jgi:hypothetical protein
MVTDGKYNARNALWAPEPLQQVGICHWSSFAEFHGASKREYRPHSPAAQQIKSPHAGEGEWRTVFLRQPTRLAVREEIT